MTTLANRLPSSTSCERSQARWVGLSWAVWVTLVVAMAAYAHARPQSHTVYDIYSAAARRWMAGEDVYVRTREYFRYSPLFAASLTPLAVLPDEWGGVVWKLANCGFLALGIGAWVRRLYPGEFSPTQVAAVFLLALPMSLHSMYNSQANLMMLASLLLGVAAAADGKWNRAAAWLAWATLVKGYPMALALLLAALFPRRFAPRFLFALGVGLLLPFAMQRPAFVQAEYASWCTHLFDSTQIMRERVRTVDWLAMIYYRPLSERGFFALEVGGGLLVLARSLWERKRTSDPRAWLATTFDWFALWVVLLGPATEGCTYIVFAPTAAMAVVRAFALYGGVARLATVVGLVMMGPLVTDLPGRAIRNFAVDHGSQPLGALLLLGYMVSQTLPRRQPPADGGPRRAESRIRVHRKMTSGSTYP